MILLLEKTWKLLKKNKRYVLILLLFIFVAQTQQINVTKKTTPRKTLLKDTNLTIDTYSSSKTIDKAVEISEEGYYRIGFEYKVRPAEYLYPKDSFEPVSGAEQFDPSVLSKSKLTFGLFSSSVGSNNLGSFESSNSPDYNYIEVVSKITDNYSTFYLTKEIGDDNQIFVKNFRTTKLNINSLDEARYLKPTEVGKRVTLVNEIPVEDKDYKPIYSFRKNLTTVGQIFKADFEYLTDVSLKLDFPGIPDGEFTLQLNEASFVDNEFRVDPKMIKTVTFSSRSVAGFAQSEPDLYLFPFQARLEKGKYYFIGIDAVNAEVGFFKRLRIFGTKNVQKYENGAAVLILGDDKVKVIGQAYFHLSGVDFTSHSNLLSGAIVEDKGGGKGIYSYETKGNIYDYFDVLDAGNSSPVSYVKNNQGNLIVASAENGNHVIWPVDTIHPFVNMQFEAESLTDDNYLTQFYYSYDKNSWKRIPSEKNLSGEEDKGRSSMIIPTNGGSKLFIKATYDPKSRGGSGSIGIKKLKLKANLIIK